MKKSKPKKLQSGPRRRSAGDVAGLLGRALAEAAGQPEAAATLAAKTTGPAGDDQCDIFYVIGRPKDGPLVTSCSAEASPDFDPFWKGLSEYAWVEIKWWCGDHGYDVAQTWKKVRPDCFDIGSDGVLRPVRDPEAYDAVRKRGKRSDRRFAFLDRALPDVTLLRLLRQRLEEVFGIRLAGGLKFG